MVGSVGHLATFVALLLSLGGAGLAMIAGRTRRSDLWDYTRLVVGAVFAVATLANLAMVYALVAHDFSVSYVAQVGSRSTPLFYTVVSLWSSLDGSILFWGWVLAAYSFAVAMVHRRAYLRLMPYATGVLLVVGAFFWFLVTWSANPFAPVFPVPVDGPGPNPLLQTHPFMGLHPPLLYLGYVGMTVPFAFAMAALMSGELGATWLRASRRWTLAAWAFLSWGIVGGGWWSYEVLGWGGYWAWDPVENASLMPWITATAFLHSAMVQERRGTMRTWNVGLVTATFVLTLLGTFLTRSGVLGSVHAFAEGLIGPLLLGFIAFVLIAALALIGWRSEHLRAPGALDHWLSRETAFLLNNLLFAAFAFTVLLGTLFPLLVEIFRGVQVSVGAPYFNEMTMPLLLALLLLAGVGPALAWRRTSVGALRRKVLLGAGVAIIGTGLLWLVGVRGAYTILALGLAAFAFVLNLAEFWIGARARNRAQGEPLVGSLFSLIRKDPRRHGGYVVHIGVALMAIGIATSSSFQRKTEATLRPGEAVRIGDYGLRLDSLYAGREPNRDFVAAGISAQRGASHIGDLRPRLNYYRNSDRPIATPAVRSRWLEDLYVTLGAYERDGSSATIEVLLNPLIGWIWGGALVIAGGVWLALWPSVSAVSRRRRPAGAHPAEPGASLAARVAEPRPQRQQVAL